MVPSFDGPGKVRPLKGSVHTLQPLAPSGESAFSLKALCICFPFKCHKCEVNIYAKVMTDRWCHNDFQNLGQARACLGSPHTGLLELTQPFCSDFTLQRAVFLPSGLGGVNYA